VLGDGSGGGGGDLNARAFMFPLEVYFQRGRELADAGCVVSMFSSTPYTGGMKGGVRTTALPWHVCGSASVCEGVRSGAYALGGFGRVMLCVRAHYCWCTMRCHAIPLVCVLVLALFLSRTCGSLAANDTPRLGDGPL